MPGIRHTQSLVGRLRAEKIENRFVEIGADNINKLSVKCLN